MAGNYDPISLSDMESGDVWITEMRDLLSPLEPSCINDDECFQVAEGETRGSGKKTKKKRYKYFCQVKKICLIFEIFCVNSCKLGHLGPRDLSYKRVDRGDDLPENEMVEIMQEATQLGNEEDVATYDSE